MITFGIAILLAAGLAVAKLCQLFKLPSVTGYIIAGLMLGPTGFSLVTEHSIGHSLDHFTQIALMLIAFGIGEHIEVKKLKDHAKSLLSIGISETMGAFLAVSISIYCIITFTPFSIQGWEQNDYIALSVLLGAVSVATAPAATLLVIRELKAKGPLTSTLMAIVAIDDGLAIMIFGIAISVTQQFIGQAGDPIYIALFNSIMEILQSILLGLATGIALSVIVGKMRSNAEIMTAGLSILLLCSEAAIFFHLSPLLAGMTAGFTLVNKAERDVRIFRALNHFEPPIYVLFFTLAGTHLNIHALGSAGLIGLGYFLARIAGKIFGVRLGAYLVHSHPAVKNYLGFALVPQAGVAIGLIFLISANPALEMYAEVITPVVLAGVFLSELIGPLCARHAVTKAKEIGIHDESANSTREQRQEEAFMRSEAGIKIVPWAWENLSPTHSPKDVVVFGAANQNTVTGLARTATILAHYYGAHPMAVRVDSSRKPDTKVFISEQQEVEKMGYSLLTEHIPDPHIASGLVAAIEYNRAKAVVLGYPLNSESGTFQKILETVASNVHCPVVVVRFYGELHTERILVPVTDMADLKEVYQIICGFNSVGEHQVRILYMMSSTAEKHEIQNKEDELHDWLALHSDMLDVEVKATPTSARVEKIKKEAENFDIVVMGATRTGGVRRFFFGSLADAVSKELRKPLFIVYNADKS